MPHRMCTIASFYAVSLAVFACVGCSSGGSSAAPVVAPTLAFGAPGFFGTGGVGGRGLMVADVDGDGRADVFIANETLANVSLLRGQADGSLLIDTPVAAPSLVAAAVVADVTGDRQVDIVSASGTTTDATLSIGVGDGTFNLPIALTMPWPVCKLAVVDWNGDGVADLMAASALVSEVGLLLGLGGGVFGPATIVTLPYAPADFAIADIDRDQRPDLVTTGQGALRIDVWRNDGVGGFLPPATTVTDARGGDFVCCDLNGDRLPDLVSVDGNLQSVTVFLAIAGSSFVPGRTIGVSNTTIDSLSLGDLDGDGLVDLVVAAGNQVLAAYGEGAGVLSGTEVLWSHQTMINSVFVGDLFGTGVVDVACVVGGNQVAVLNNPRLLPIGLSTFGHGTPGCRGEMGMWASGSPTVGNAQFAYSTTNGPADALGVFMQGATPDPVGSDPFGNGVTMHIGLGLTLFTRLVFSDQLGSSYIPDPVPNDPGLVGLPIQAQAIWLDDPATTCSPSAANLVSTHGLTVTIQP